MQTVSPQTGVTTEPSKKTFFRYDKATSDGEAAVLAF